MVNLQSLWRGLRSLRGGILEEKKFVPWNKGKDLGHRKPFTLPQVISIRNILVQNGRYRDLVLFSVGIDTALRSSDLLSLKVKDVLNGQEKIRSKFAVRPMKTNNSQSKNTHWVELLDFSKIHLKGWILQENKTAHEYLFTGKMKKDQPITRRQYANLVKDWAGLINLPTEEYSTHSVRRTWSNILYEITKNPKLVQEFLGHALITSTQSYFDAEVQKAWDLRQTIAKKQNY